MSLIDHVFKVGTFNQRDETESLQKVSYYSLESRYCQTFDKVAHPSVAFHQEIHHENALKLLKHFVCHGKPEQSKHRSTVNFEGIFLGEEAVDERKSFETNFSYLF